MSVNEIVKIFPDRETTALLFRLYEHVDFTDGEIMPFFVGPSEVTDANVLIQWELIVWVASCPGTVKLTAKGVAAAHCLVNMFNRIILV